jgi:intracellular sulfur oxidation DsrE/DsrF family protein
MKQNVLFAAALALVLMFSAVSQTPAAPKHRVVFQLTEPQGPAWDMLIGHIQNMRTAFAKDGSEVEVVFFGPGLSMLVKTNTAQQEKLKQLAESGVTLAACQNAMRFYHVKTEDLFSFASQVDSGVAELARKQEAGWAYIH